MHFSTVAKALTHHTHSEEKDGENSGLSRPNTHSDTNSLSLSKTSTHTSTHSATLPFKIERIYNVDELEQLLDAHRNQKVVIFCLTSSHKELGEHEEAWYYQYAKLNHMHFVRVDLDESPGLEERLALKAKPSWVAFHKGVQTGWSSGGVKRFVQMHSAKKGAH